MRRVITFGTFDLLHKGHLRILKRGKELGDYLVVGVSTDRLNAEKGKRSFFPQDQRLECVAALKYVDEVFLEDSLELKNSYIKEHKADLLVMGDDWDGKFDWVDCEVQYLSRTPNVSSSESKLGIAELLKCKKVVFGDTYIKKHYDCALSIINELTASNIAPILTVGKKIPSGIDCDCIVYFNKPVHEPSEEYADKPRVLIDHGASNLKWFLASQARYDFFDIIITAGPDHSQSLMSFFAEESSSHSKVRSAGFIKSSALFAQPRLSRVELAEKCNLDPTLPIVLFAPTWHISNNKDMAQAILEVSSIANHVASLHPETAHLDTSMLNLVENTDGMTTELLKHADCVVSDTSSTIFEAAALGKPVVQIGLREYSDNNAILFDFPYVAGTSELFCGGIFTRPGDVKVAVQIALSKGGLADDAMKVMHARLLEGTRIRSDSGHDIVEEISRACDLSRAAHWVGSDVAGRSRNLERVHQNLRFAKNRLIAHGGGDFGSHHASNSVESIEAALASVDVVELDFVLGADGIIVAHDTFEKRYGLDRPFAEVTCDEFLSSRYGGELTSIPFKTAIARCTSNGKALVCDIKDTRASYKHVVDSIHRVASELGVLGRVVLQCYSLEDFQYATQLGFERTLLAVWKYFYKDPVGAETFEFLRRCFEVNPHSIVGVSFPYINRHMEVPSYQSPQFSRFFGFWRRLYIHGAPTEAYPDILRRNLGLFADRYSMEYQFRDRPENFEWQEYLFLNPRLVDAGCDNEISATVHYLKYGKGEGRLARYITPSEFRYAEYLDVNPGLRKGGIGGVNSARAHWTLYGASEERKYRRS